MSRENLEIVGRLYDEFLARPDRVVDPGILEFFDPDVELRQSASFFGTQGTFRGHEGLARSAREVFEVFRELHWVPVRVADAGDRVVVTVQARGYGRQSGAQIEETVAHLLTLRRGKIVDWEVYMDPADALAAAGLS